MAGPSSYEEVQIREQRSRFHMREQNLGSRSAAVPIIIEVSGCLIVDDPVSRIRSRRPGKECAGGECAGGEVVELLSRRVVLSQAACTVDPVGAPVVCTGTRLGETAYTIQGRQDTDSNLCEVLKQNHAQKPSPIHLKRAENNGSISH